MTAPTLALGISAPGATEIEKLAGYVRSLTSDLETLKTIATGGGMGGLDALTAEVAAMRKEFGTATQGIRTDLAAFANSIKDGYGKAKKTVEDGGKDLENEFNKANVRVRVAAKSVNLGDDLSASLSASGLSAVKALQDVRAQVRNSSEGLAAEYASSIKKLEGQVAAVMQAATQGPNTMRGKGYIKWWDSVIADMEAGELLLQKMYGASIAKLETDVDAIMRAATQGPNTMRGKGYIKWWDGVLADMEAAKLLLDKEYAGSIAKLESQVATIMQAATQGPNTMRGKGYIKWWDSVIADMELGEARLLKEYATSIAKLETEVAAIMRAATQPPNTMRGKGYINWWDSVLTEMEVAETKIAAQSATFVARIQAQVAAANKAAFAGKSGAFSVIGTQQEMNNSSAAAYSTALALDKLSKSNAGVSASAKGAHGAMTDFASGIHSTGGVAREGGTLLEEALSGNFGRMKQTMFAFLNQLGVMKGLVSGLVSPLGLIAAAAGLVGYAMSKGEQEVTQFKNAMTLTGGFAGQTRGQMEDLAHTIANSTVSSLGTAKTVLLDLAKTGRVTGDAMGLFGQAIVLQSKLSGDSLESLVKDYAKMPDGVHKWAEEHNKSMHFMSQAQLEHIRLLELQGKTQEAVIEVGKKLIEHMQAQTENLGYLEKGWRGLKNMASGAWDAMLGLGREDTVEQQMEKIRGRIAALQKAGTDNGSFGKYQKDQGLDSGAAVESLREQLKMLEMLKSSQEGLAKARGEDLHQQEEGSKAGDYLRSLDLKINRTQRETAALKELSMQVEKNNASWLKGGNSASKTWNGVEGFVTPDIQKQMENLIHQRDNGVKSANDGMRQLMNQEFKAEETAAATAYRNRRAALSSQYQAQEIDAAQFYANSLDAYKTYEKSLTEQFETAKANQYADLTRRQAQINNSNAPSDKKAQDVQRAANQVEAWVTTTQAAIDSVLAKADTANTSIFDNAIKQIAQEEKSNDSYWRTVEQGIQKEAALAKMRHDLADATDEERARAEAAIKVEEGHSAQVVKLTEEYDAAAKMAQEFKDNINLDDMSSNAQQGLFALLDKVEELRKRLEKTRQEVDRLKGVASDAASQELQYKKDEEIRKQAKTLGDTVRDKLSDSILSGGKTGFKGLIDWAKEYLVKQPLKWLLNLVLQPVGTAVQNFALQAAGLGSTGSALGTASSVAGLAGSASAFTSGVSSGITAWGAGGSVTGVVGSALDGSLFAGGIANGLGTLAGALGPIAIGVAAIMSFMKSGGGPKTDSYFNYPTQANNNSDQGAKALYDTIQSGFATVAGQLGLTQTQLQNLGIALSADPKGTAQTQLDVTLPGYSRGNAFGTTENVGRSDAELQAALAQAAQAAIIAGLLHSNLDQKFKDYLAGVDLTHSADELAQKISDVVGSKQVIDIFAQLGDKFAYVKDMSVDAVKALTDAGGGLQAFTANLQTYYKNFYSTTEQNNATAANIAKALGTADTGGALKQYNLNAQTILGMSRDDFRLLVESIDGTTTAGQQLLGTLMAVSGAFADIHPAVDGTADDLKKFRDAVVDLPMAHLASLTDSATFELIKFAGGVDNLVSNLQNYTKNFYSAPEQRAQSVQNIQSTLSAAGLDLGTSTIGQMTRDQFRAIVDSVDTTTSTGRALYAALINVSSAFADITPAADNGAKAMQDTVTQLTNTVSKFKDFGKQLRDFRDQLLVGDLSPLTPADQYAQAATKFNSTYAAAMGGDADAMGQLQSVAESFLKVSRDYNASNSQYTEDFSKVQQALTMAADQSDSIESVAQQQLDTQQASLDALTTLNSTAAGISNTLLNQITNSVQNATSGGGDSTGSSGGSSAVSQAYALYAARGNFNPDQQGLNYWSNLISSGTSMDQVRAAFNQSFDYVTSLAAPHANGGLAHGLSLLGERGPELVDFKTPGRVYTAAQTSGMFGSNDTMVTELRGMRQEMKELRTQYTQGVRAQIGSTYDAHDKSAAKIVRGSADKRDRAAWSERQKANLK